MIEIIFTINILATLWISIAISKISNELLYKIASLISIISIPIALVEYKIYKSDIVTAEQYRFLYAILVTLISTGFNICTTLLAKQYRLNLNHLLQPTALIAIGVIVILIHLLTSNAQNDIIRLNSGLYVYDVKHLGKKYILEILFGIASYSRLCFVSYKICKMDALSVKKTQHKLFFITSIIMTCILIAHFTLVITGFHVPFSITFFFLIQILTFYLYYKGDQSQNPLLNTEIILALGDIFNNYIVLDRNFTVIDINKVCLDLLNKRHEDVIHKSIFELYDTFFKAIDYAMPTAKILECIENEKSLKVYNEDQTLFINISATACISNKNKKIGYLLNLKNITLSEKNKQLFEATQQLKKQMLINEHFANTISHDIKTPVIEMVTTIAHSKVETVDQYQVLFESIKYSLHELKRYITQSFDYSLKTNFTEISSQIESQQLFSQIKTLFNFILLERNIQFVINGEIMLQQNKLLLEQVFINLVNNTLKHNKNQSDLLIEIDLYNNNEKNIIIYRDNGIGIQQERKENIFNSFSSTLLLADSTNIGLPMCKKIIEMMNGTIIEAGVFGNGTRFIIELPILELNAINIHKKTLALISNQ